MMRFVRALAVSVLMGAVSPAYGQESDIFALMDRAVEMSPTLRAANSKVSEAEARADGLIANPYPFQISASAGQRFIDDPLTGQTDFTEFGAGISRTLRLPSKRRVDEELADVEIEISKLSIEAARFEEMQMFVTLWNSWVMASAVVSTSERQALDAKELATLEQAKVDKGSGRQIEADMAFADALIIEARANQDKQAAQQARFVLQNRYPAIEFPQHPMRLNANGDVTPMSSLKSLPSYRLAHLKSEKLRLASKRENLNTRPDPNFGLDVSDEFGGREHSIMARISIPLGGRAQSAARKEALAIASNSELEARMALERAQREYALALENVKISRASCARTQTAKDASAKVVNMTEVGYAAGAVSLRDVLTTRQNHRDIERLYADLNAKYEADLLLLKLYQRAMSR